GGGDGHAIRGIREESGQICPDYGRWAWTQKGSPEFCGTLWSSTTAERTEARTATNARACAVPVPSSPPLTSCSPFAAARLPRMTRWQICHRFLHAETGTCPLLPREGV